LRVEYLSNVTGNWVGVTTQWLGYGFGRDYGLPPSTPFGGAGANTVGPAILILQQLQSPVGTVANATGAASTRFNWIPINFYDSREGEPRDPATRAGTLVSPIGVMNAVELDVGNLWLWLQAKAGTPYAGGSGTAVNSTKDKGYILYFSDQRGMIPDPDAPYLGTMAGSSLLEDVVNSGSALGGSGRQNNFRAATGLVLRFGIPNPPPPPNHAPAAACSVNPASVYAGSGDTVSVHVNASDPDNDSLSYSYSATGGSVDGAGADVRWSSTGAAVGSYTVNAKVDDGKGGTASCSADIKVEEKPNHPPTASLSVERSPIVQGERTGITCSGSDPDNDPLTYSYTSTGGQIVGSGSSVQFDSNGLQPGSYTVNCSVNDGRGASADASGKVEVKEPPQIKQLEAKLALHSIYFPTAQPTVAKPNGGLAASQAATLDTLAGDFQQYVKYRPDAHLILEGHADIRGAKDYNIKLSERRVERTKSYLVEKGVPADHIETKAFGFEKNMTSEEVKKLIEADPDLSVAEKQKILKNLLTVRLANNRRVDVTLSTTGEQSVRRFPFNAKDALTLLSRAGGETGKTGKAGTAGKAKTPTPAPKKKTNP